MRFTSPRNLLIELATWRYSCTTSLTVPLMLGAVAVHWKIKAPPKAGRAPEDFSLSTFKTAVTWPGMDFFQDEMATKCKVFDLNKYNYCIVDQDDNEVNGDVWSEAVKGKSEIKLKVPARLL